MKPSEILNALADLASKISADEKSRTSAVNAYPAEKRFVPVKVPKAPEEHTDKDQELPLDTMVPPLQQKIELMKRAVDVDNAFDGTPIDKLSQQKTATDNGTTTEISIIIKNAGLNPTKKLAVNVLGDDDPLDN
jgi:hypothetical protein